MYIYNLRDAYLTGKTIDETSEYLTSLEYFKKTKNRNFHYMVVIPIGIAFLFVVVMPIIFSILTAFLNYNRVIFHQVNCYLGLDFITLKNYLQYLLVSNIF